MKEGFRSKFKVSITKFYRRFSTPNVFPHNRVMRIHTPGILSYSYINNKLLNLIKQRIIFVDLISCWRTKGYILKRMTTSLVLRRLCKFNFEIVDDHIYKNFLYIYYQSTSENHIVSILSPTLRELEKIGYLTERLPDEF